MFKLYKVAEKQSFFLKDGVIMDNVVEELKYQYKISSDKDPIAAIAHYDHIQGHEFFKRKGVVEWNKLNNDQKIECVERYLDWVAKQKENE